MIFHNADALRDCLFYNCDTNVATNALTIFELILDVTQSSNLKLVINPNARKPDSNGKVNVSVLNALLI